MPKGWMMSAGVTALLSVSVAALGSFAPSQAATGGIYSPGQQWPYYGGTDAFDRYSPLAQINRSNLDRLQVLWVRPATDVSLMKTFSDLSASHYLRSTPIMLDGVLYASDALGLVEAFEAKSGKTLWVQRPFSPGLKGAVGQSHRGVAAWRGDGGLRIFSVRGQYLYALNAKDGMPIKSFGADGRVYLNRDTPDKAPFFGWNGPMVIGNVIIMGGNGGGLEDGGYADGGNSVFARPENIRAYDVVTGKKLWSFHLMPSGARGERNWGNSMWFTGNMAAWAPITADPETGYIYVPTSAPTNSYYGGHRPGNNIYANSIICIDSKTGKEVWHFQLVHHDLWDYDTSSAPVLADLHVNGKPVKAVIVTNKTGFIFVFNRLTGKPLWPIVERPVPQSTVPGEHTSPTQPFPTRPKPYDVLGLNDNDLINFTPQLNKDARAYIKQYVTGPVFTPPAVDGVDGKKGALLLPGDWGSGNWNTGAFDPETGYYYAASMTMPDVFALHRATNPSDSIAYMEGSDAPRHGTPHYARDRNPYGFGPHDLPLTRPPYGRITAYDMNTGKQLWIAANGAGPRNSPLLKSLHLPDLGNPNRSAVLITKTLLFAGDTGDAVMGGFGIDGPAKFRAFDKKTGKVLGAVSLPAGLTSGPMTYEVDGKQVIVFAIGSRSHAPEWVALALR